MRLARTEWRPPTLAAAATLVVLTLAAGGLAVVRLVTGSQGPSWLMYSASSVGALAALALAVDSRLPWGRILRPMEWARDSTLGIYLVHVALISYVFPLIPPMQPLLRSFVAAVVIFFSTAVLVALAQRWKPARAVL
jgi:peptidoglycan/LPS O-acetylase OafA/YrhL